MSALQRDDSVIDVTGQSAVINYDQNVSYLRRYVPGVPAWPHQYIYSHTELSQATNQQLEFYQTFKQTFLAGEYLDLEGYNNYAFVLLFDLLKVYESHNDLRLLEKQITSLVINYPKTKAYGLSKLSLAMEDNGDLEGIDRLRLLLQNPADNSLKLGTRHKKKLGLTSVEVELLNKIWFPDNNFCNIEFCQVQVVKLFLLIVNALEHKYLKEGTVSTLVFNNLAHDIAEKQLGSGINNYNYKYAVLSVISDIYTLIFKYSENAVRETYGHARKLNTDISYQDPDTKTYYETSIIDKVKALLPIWVSRVEMPDELTEIELFAKNTSRWKRDYQQICQQFTRDPKSFYKHITNLGVLNAKNPSVESIYFEAFKHIAKQNKTVSLSLYVHYVFEDLKSATFDNRQLSKAVQKHAFENAEQVQEFEKIINDLLKDKDLEKALKAVGQLHLPKRKKIILDLKAINEISERHSDTVELLNKFLDDEPEAMDHVSQLADSREEEVIIAIVNHTPLVASPSLYKQDFGLLPIHIQVIEVFKKSSLILSEADLEAFAKANGAFKSQLIDRINELCYELLDDVLIEEEDGNFIINEDYYNSILI
jgi:hypothetical protein